MWFLKQQKGWTKFSQVHLFIIKRKGSRDVAQIRFTYLYCLLRKPKAKKKKKVQKRTDMRILECHLSALVLNLHSNNENEGFIYSTV